MSSHDITFGAVFAASTADATKEGAVPNGGGQQDAPPRSGEGFGNFLPVLIVIMVLFFWFSSRSNKRRRNERTSMLAAIRPRDEVVTIGGIQGRVVEVSEETITLCIDSDRGTRMTFTRSAISRRLGEPEQS
jgi:preprotein translocase subunit YajC